MLRVEKTKMDNNLNPLEHKKEYAVVKFLNPEKDLEETFSEVLAKWIVFSEDENKKRVYKCWWPRSGMNVTSLIMKKCDPNPKTWILLKVEIDVFCTNLISARRRASGAKYYSMQDDDLGRGNQTNNCSISENLDSQEQVKKKQKLLQNSQDNTHTNNSIFMKSPTEPLLFEKPSSSNPSVQIDNLNNNKNRTKNNDSFPENNKQLSTIDKLLRICAQMRLEVKDLNKRVMQLEQGQNMISVQDDLESIKVLLPLRRTKHVNEFNDKLETCREFKLLFEKYILQIGRAATKKDVYSVLKKVFTNKCSTHYTWKGMKGKPAASKLYLMNNIKGIMCSVYTSLKETEFDKFATEWFRLSNQRYKRDKSIKLRALLVDQVEEETAENSEIRY